MRSSQQFLTIFATTLLFSSTAQAAHVDMKVQDRALGRQDDVRVDAQMFGDVVSARSPISVTCQIQNLSDAAIAVADKVSDSSYDADSQTITLSVGAEIPQKTFPHLTVIAPGETTTFTAGAVPHLAVRAAGAFSSLPRYVQISVNVLRDVTPFRDAIARQSANSPPLPISDESFARWLDANESIVLNPLPVRWSAAPAPEDGVSADRRSPPEVAATGGNR